VALSLSEFIIDKEEVPKTPEKKEKKSIKTPRITRQDIIDRLIKMFRAASNGRKAYQSWFPEETWMNPGEFEAAYISDLYKLK